MDAKVNLLCPRCRADMTFDQGSSRTNCPTCSTSFECVFVRPPRGEVQERQQPAWMRGDRGTCYAHPEVAATSSCRRCHKSVCEVCTFVIGGLRLCPECSSKPAPGSASIGKALASIALGIMAVLCVAGMFVYLVANAGQVSEREAEAVGSLGVIGCMLCSFVGLTLGFISRDEARRAGSPLGVIGIVINLLMVGLMLLLMVAGALAGS